MCTLESILKEIPDRIAVKQEELDELQGLIVKLLETTKQLGLTLTQDRAVMIAVHLLAFNRRVKSGEHLPELDEGMIDEATPEFIEASREVLEFYSKPINHIVDDAEVFFLAIHFEAARD
ncbi:PRD domain-containing protein [Paenibacillus sp. N1-5-1-14]|uniref:PRD domain-containing protein n=1 Tax=Paenibacillus radicibacter TaxID=2972488 RepID=UPI002159056A|nr:PRD domain-containing protein [Paenibacillus radicibacter]MCR8644847.1 PRD domain-containing protein [Paenibacillus radicibacter]